MVQLIQQFKEYRSERKAERDKKNKLWKQLISYDNKCRRLRLQLAKANVKADTRDDYQINEQKVKQLIFFSLQQLKIRNKLNYD